LCFGSAPMVVSSYLLGSSRNELAAGWMLWYPAFDCAGALGLWYVLYAIWCHCVMFRWKVFWNCGKWLLNGSWSAQEKLWTWNRHMECLCYLIYIAMRPPFFVGTLPSLYGNLL
jgi:hypothetical protein